MLAKSRKGAVKRNPNRGSCGKCLACHPVQDYHTVILFQHKRSTKQAKHETKNKQKATKIQKFRHLVISIEIILHHLKNKNWNILKNQMSFTLFTP